MSKENRNKTDVFYGYVSEIYSHVFLVSNGSSKKSYSYSDILSKDIQVTLNTYTSIFNKYKEKEIEKVEQYFSQLH